MPSEKTYPQNDVAERCILGAILQDNSALPIATRMLHAGDFFQTPHRVIWRRMLALQQNGVGIDIVTLIDALDNAKELNSAASAGISGSAYVSSLADGQARVSNVEHYCKIVKDCSTRRQAIQLAGKMQTRAWEGEETPTALLASMQKDLAALSPATQQIVGGNGKLTYSVDEFMAEKFPPPEHLIEWIFSKSGSALIVAKPHHLKSWYTLALSLLATIPGELLNKLNVPSPVRTLLVSVEDFPGQTQERMDKLLSRDGYKHIDRERFRILPRPIGGLDIMEEASYQRVLKEIDAHKADVVIFDVLRRIFRGDINSPKESSLLCEQMERIRDTTGASTVIVHHENRKEADIMSASAGSFNLPGWANSVIRFQRKQDEILCGAKVSTVEIEVDNKFAPNPDPMRMVLDLSSETPVRLEDLEDASGIADLRQDLGMFWSVRDLAEALTVHPSNAKRRLKKMLNAGIAEKVAEGKRGRQGGLARYQFVGAGE